MAISEHWLHRRFDLRGAHPVRFASQLFILDARGVLYCPSRDALVVSDLHFEKASYLSRFANPLPQFDTLSTLLRLQQIILDYQPRQIICLGDSFHDAKGYYRMSEQEQSLLQAMTNMVADWLWVQGNHDPEIPPDAGGRSVQQERWVDIILRHEPESDIAEAQIIGHFHPKSRLTIARKRFGGKCFVLDNQTLIMPAFGQYTGGLDIDSEPLSALLNNANRLCFLLYDGAIYTM